MTDQLDPTTAHPDHGGMNMDANDQNPELPRPIPTPAEALKSLHKASPGRMIHVPHLDERPAHALPLADLSPEQRSRAEALHVARRVLGNPVNREGQLPYGWADSAAALANYVITGTIVRDPCHDTLPESESEKQPEPVPSAGIGVVEIGIEGDLPKDMPAHVKQFVEIVRARLVGHADPETRRANLRKYVDDQRDKPDGYKELNTQGIFPVDGSEPPRSEALHDVDGRRWTFNRAANVWERSVTPADIAAGPHLASSTWGLALAEFSPFHSAHH